MSEKSAEFEPELQIQPPRTLRPRWRSRVIRWLFITLAVIAPGLLIYFGWACQQDWTALREHGAKTVGRVVERIPPKPGKDGHPPKAVYEFTVDGKSHRLTKSLDEPTYEKLKLGDEAQLVYLPEAPDTSATADDLSNQGDTASSAVALWVVAAIISVIAWPCWLWLEHESGKWRRLMREGLPVRTTSLAVDHSSQWNAQTSTRTSYWTVRYEFPLDGETKSGKVSVEADVAQKLQQPGAQATVLYDPLNPKVFQLYPAIAKMYQIEPPEAERFQI